MLTREQARAAGLTDKVIAGRVARGYWQRIYPGVYAAFSGTPGRICLLWAAVLRAGPESALSHQTAGELWGLGGGVLSPGGSSGGGGFGGAGFSGDSSSAIHVTVPSGSPVAPMPGVILHYSQRVVQARHPVATPPRTRVEETVLDLAAAARTAEDAVAWIFKGCASRRTTAAQLAAAMSARRRMRWRAEITRALDPALCGVHSLLEYRYLYRVERPHGLPVGIRQRPGRRGTRREYADVDYERYATIVELDGRLAHPGLTRLLDVRRDNANLADGRVTLRYGWTDVSERSCEVAMQVAAALRRRGWSGRLRRCGASCKC